MPDLDHLLDLVLRLLGYVYGQRWVVPFVLLPIILLLAATVHVYATVVTRPYLRAAKSRINALRTCTSHFAPAAGATRARENAVAIRLIKG